jgi:regulator of sigma E protease
VVRAAAGDGQEQTLDVTMTPRANPPQNQGALGIQIGTAIRPVNPAEAVWTGARSLGNVIFLTFALPANLIREGRPISEAGFMGPVGIAATTGEVVRSSMAVNSVQPIIWFIALLSAALGITNLLPLPALDGGRLLFVLIETIRGKRIEPAREGLVHLIGFGLLLLLVGLLTVREVGALLNGTFPSLGIR